MRFMFSQQQDLAPLVTFGVGSLVLGRGPAEVSDFTIYDTGESCRSLRFQSVGTGDFLTALWPVLLFVLF